MHPVANAHLLHLLTTERREEIRRRQRTRLLVRGKATRGPHQTTEPQ